MIGWEALSKITEEKAVHKPVLVVTTHFMDESRRASIEITMRVAISTKGRLLVTNCSRPQRKPMRCSSHLRSAGRWFFKRATGFCEGDSYLFGRY